MTIKEKHNWLFVNLEAPERNPDLDWNGLVRWKVPRSERAYVFEMDTWLVHRKHRQLVNTLYFIYSVMGDPDPHPAEVKQISNMLECVEKWYPVKEQIQEKLQELVGFKAELN